MYDPTLSYLVKAESPFHLTYSQQSSPLSRILTTRQKLYAYRQARKAFQKAPQSYNSSETTLSQTETRRLMCTLYFDYFNKYVKETLPIISWNTVFNRLESVDFRVNSLTRRFEKALSMMIITTGVYITETRADLVMPYISYIPSIALLQCYSKLNEFCYWSVKRSPSPTDFAIFLMLEAFFNISPSFNTKETVINKSSWVSVYSSIKNYKSDYFNRISNGIFRVENNRHIDTLQDFMSYFVFGMTFMLRDLERNGVDQCDTTPLEGIQRFHKNVLAHIKDNDKYILGLIKLALQLYVLHDSVQLHWIQKSLTNVDITWRGFDEVRIEISKLENSPERHMIQDIIKNFDKIVISAYRKLLFSWISRLHILALKRCETTTEQESIETLNKSTIKTLEILRDFCDACGMMDYMSFYLDHIIPSIYSLYFLIPLVIWAPTAERGEPLWLTRKEKAKLCDDAYDMISTIHNIASFARYPVLSLKLYTLSLKDSITTYGEARKSISILTDMLQVSVDIINSVYHDSYESEEVHKVTELIKTMFHNVAIFIIDNFNSLYIEDNATLNEFHDMRMYRELNKGQTNEGVFLDDFDEFLNLLSSCEENLSASMRDIEYPERFYFGAKILFDEVLFFCILRLSRWISLVFSSIDKQPGDKLCTPSSLRIFEFQTVCSTQIIGRSVKYLEYGQNYSEEFEAVILGGEETYFLLDILLNTKTVEKGGLDGYTEVVKLQLLKSFLSKISEIPQKYSPHYQMISALETQIQSMEMEAASLEQNLLAPFTV